MGAHDGINDTMDRIKEHYYFSKMSIIIRDFVKSCKICQSRKMTQAKIKANAVSFPAPSKPFDVLQIDLQGPLPVSYKGNAYIFTALCMFSKFLFAVPIPAKNFITVSSAL